MNPTPEQLAEQHGHAETAAVLTAMRGAKTQAARLLLLHTLLVELSHSEYPERALAGFSVAMLGPLERAMGVA